MNTLSDSGLLFLIAGPSGVGKNSMIASLLEQDDLLEYVPSTTTREIRSDETQGHPYNFVTPKTFDKLVQEGQMLEWQEVHGAYYGSSLRDVKKVITKGENAITDLDVLGVHDVLLRLPASTCSVFILPPSKEALIKRIQKRHGDRPRDLDQRLSRAVFEYSQLGLFDFAICSVTNTQAASEMLSITRAARRRQLLYNELAKSGSIPAFRRARYTVVPTDESCNPVFRGAELLLPQTPLMPAESERAAFRRLVSMISFKNHKPMQLGPSEIVSAETSAAKELEMGNHLIHEIEIRIQVSRAAFTELYCAINANP